MRGIINKKMEAKKKKHKTKKVRYSYFIGELERLWWGNLIKCKLLSFLEVGFNILSLERLLPAARYCQVNPKTVHEKKKINNKKAKKTKKAKTRTSEEPISQC